MQYAMDTNIIIHLLHGTAAVREARDNALKRGAKLIIPPFVNYEIMRGFLYQAAPKREAIYRLMKESYAIGEMTTSTWEKAAAVYATVRHAGFTVGDADILIAAFCLVNGFTLVTNNTRDFNNMVGLKLADWTKPTANNFSSSSHE